MSTTPQSDNPYASPQSEEAAVIDSNPTPAWREGQLVVVAPDGELPPRCVHCGKDATVGTWHRMYSRTQLLGLPYVLVWLFVPGIIFAGLSISQLITPRLLASLGYSVKSPHAALWVAAVLNAGVSLLLILACRNQRAAGLKFWICRPCTWRGRLVSGIVVPIVILTLYYFLSGLQFTLSIGLPIVFAQSPLWVVMPMLSDARRVTKREAGMVWVKGFRRAFWSTLPPYPSAAERSSPATVR